MMSSYTATLPASLPEIDARNLAHALQQELRVLIGASCVVSYLGNGRLGLDVEIHALEPFATSVDRWRDAHAGDPSTPLQRVRMDMLPVLERAAHPLPWDLPGGHSHPLP
ncbi:MAG: hypothetical protein ACYC8T_25190 [Myxococcaceae bacterium]